MYPEPSILILVQFSINYFIKQNKVGFVLNHFPMNFFMGNLDFQRDFSALQEIAFIDGQNQHNFYQKGFKAFIAK